MTTRKRAVSGSGPVSTKKVFGLETLTPDNGLPSGYLSVTQVEMYLRCPKQYEFRYVKQIKNPPAVALSEGSAHHTAVEFDMRCYIGSGEYEDPKIVTEVFCDAFNDEAKNIPRNEWLVSGDTKDSVISRGKKMIAGFTAYASRFIRPVRTERKIEVMFGGVPMIGFIDIEENERILDLKVVKNVKSDSEASADIQLSTYAFATGKKHVGFICMKKNSPDPTPHYVKSTRSKYDIVVAGSVVRSVADAIKLGAFPMCNPTNTFPCSAKWCGYWNKCRGGFYTT